MKHLYEMRNLQSDLGKPLFLLLQTKGVGGGGLNFNVLSFSHYVAASTGTNNKCVMFSGFSPTNT